MGSFNVTCGISSASISEGERVGMVPIVPNRYSYRSKWVFGGTDQYIPVASPIYGTYNDYGNIEDIERSAITEYLEHEYQMPIETFTQCLQSDSPLDDEVSEFFYGKDSVVLANLYAEVTDDLLRKVGFTAVDEDESAIKIWDYHGHKVIEEPHQENPTPYPLYSIFQEDRPLNSTTVHATSFNRLMDGFHKATNLWLGLDKEKSQQADRAFNVTFMVFLPDVFNGIVENGEIQGTYSRSYDKTVKLLSELALISPADEMGLNGRDHTREVVEPSNVTHLIQDPDSWLPVFQLRDVMVSANKAYMPTVHGEQHGNAYTEKVIGEILVKRAGARIDEYESYS